MSQKDKSDRRLTRGAGILMPISSLPSPYGIGTLGKEAYRFADFVKKTGGMYWQVLPIGPTSYGDSPYQSFSAFAGNPYFIDLDILCEEGLLTKEEITEKNWGERPDRVDYEKIYNNRFEVLKLAFSRSKHEKTAAYKKFEESNAFWLMDYSFYMAVKKHFNDKSWQEWDDDIRLRKETAVKKYEKALKKEIDFYKWLQFKFDEQWKKLKAYVNELGIKIIGDIPLYVALDSSDVWVHSDLFELDEDLREKNVAGVPPDLFSETGQRWGNPLYRWDVMEKDGFGWWKERMKSCAYHYDIIRIDHFIGVVNYYSIPAACKTAMVGKWKKGPGKKLTEMINANIGDAQIIAEDLGVLTKPVKDLIAANGYPGMKILLFAMDLKPNNDYLPHNFESPNSIVYIGTHDNDTLVGALASIPEPQQRKIANYYYAENPYGIASAMIRSVYASVADVCILQMQDMLYLDNNARMNTPSTLGGNWLWRLCDDQYIRIDTEHYSAMAKMYGRSPETEEEEEEKDGEAKAKPKKAKTTKTK
ncbi:MAG: 4-alpha-glucanotransferase [Lachnospiraceae bacterium]|nr:4-alpha-glucanotransferase [Lachnospiraceae bacterium]